MIAALHLHTWQIFSPFFRTDPERIVLSREVAVKFIKDILPNHVIKPVPGDGFCIIHAFQENLKSIGRTESFEEITLSLQQELQKNKYQKSVTNNIVVLDEFRKYMENPSSQYDKEITDLFLDALGMAYRVNLIVFRSDCKNCYIMDYINPDNGFKDTLYFVRTISVHIDPVVPSADREIAEQSDSDDSVVLTAYKKGSPALGVKKTEDDYSTSALPSAQGRTPLQSVDNTNSFTNDFEIDVSFENDAAPSDVFDYNKPSANMLFQCLLVEPEKYEVPTPLKRCRSNRVYTVKVAAWMI